METLDNLLVPLQAFLGQVGDLAPKLLLAVVILAGGWLAAKAIRFAVVKTLRAINFHILTERAGLDAFLQQGGGHADTTALLGLLAYWLALLAALVLACDSLGLVQVTALLGRMAMFVPRLMLALVILAGGAYFAGVIDGAVAGYGRNAGLDEAALLGRAARYAVLVFVVLLALEQLDIGAELIRYSFLIILGGLVLALALAFGLGGQKWAAALLEHWQATRAPQQGGGTDREH
ncbi:MAG: hypothetical protein A2045_06760 [Rhodocyclales bacterium GWA2_65_20]|nr:MAG: hypothetical protein A2045_06760 [Rhodocyclales bacterium GWA2_65_20]